MNCDGYFVEIQVRTPYQHLWAQVFERLGDEWGRQIRYGEPPNDPDKFASALGGVTLTDVVEEMKELSGLIDDFESFQAKSDFEQTDSNRSNLLEQARKIIDDSIISFAEVAPVSRPMTVTITKEGPEQESDIHFFLVVYDRPTGQLHEITMFSRSQFETMAQKRDLLEHKHQGDSDTEIVVLSSGSQEELQKTHARYFETTAELVKLK